MTLSERLRACATKVRQGWCQRRLADGHGGVCALGAMLVIDGLSVDGQWMPPESLCTVLRQVLGTNGIAAWNDAPDQTAENVAQAFELAALLADQKHVIVADHEAVCC